MYFTSNIFRICTKAPCLIYDTGKFIYSFLFLEQSVYWSSQRTRFCLTDSSPLFVHLLFISKLIFILSSIYFVVAFIISFSSFFFSNTSTSTTDLSTPPDTFRYIFIHLKLHSNLF